VGPEAGSEAAPVELTDLGTQTRVDTALHQRHDHQIWSLVTGNTTSYTGASQTGKAPA